MAGKTSTPALTEYIVETPGTCGGRPRIRGRRITVAHVAMCRNDLGMTIGEIVADYDLSEHLIAAALAYYNLNRAEIDARQRADEAHAEAMRKELESRRPSPL